MCPRASVRRLSSSTSDALTFFYFDVGHYLENTGNTTLHFLEIFDTGRFPYNLSRPWSVTYDSERARSFPGYQPHPGTVRTDSQSCS